MLNSSPFFVSSAPRKRVFCNNTTSPTIQKLINDGGKVILCSHLGKVKNGPNEGESLAPVAEKLSEKLGKKVNFVSDYNVTGEAATKAVAEMNEGDVVLLQNTRFRGAEETQHANRIAKNFTLFQKCFGIPVTAPITSP